jgi:hypothetical protein
MKAGLDADFLQDLLPGPEKVAQAQDERHTPEIKVALCFSHDISLTLLLSA